MSKERAQRRREQTGVTIAMLLVRNLLTAPVPHTMMFRRP